MTRCSDLNCDSCNPGQSIDWQDRAFNAESVIRKVDLLLGEAQDKNLKPHEVLHLVKQAAIITANYLDENA